MRMSYYGRTPLHESVGFKLSLAGGVCVGLLMATLSTYSTSVMGNQDIIGLIGMLISWLCAVALTVLAQLGTEISWMAKSGITALAAFLLAALAAIFRLNFIGICLYWGAACVAFLYLIICCIVTYIAKAVIYFKKLSANRHRR